MHYTTKTVNIIADIAVNLASQNTNATGTDVAAEFNSTPDNKSPILPPTVLPLVATDPPSLSPCRAPEIISVSPLPGKYKNHIAYVVCNTVWGFKSKYCKPLQLLIFHDFVNK